MIHKPNMEDIIQHFRTLFISFASSSLFFIPISFYFLTSGKMGIAFFEVRIPGVYATVFGAAVASVYSVSTAFILIWKRSDSLLMNIKASIISMEILALLICSGIFLLELSAGAAGDAAPKGLFVYLQVLSFLAVMFLCISVILAVPAIMIGVTNSFLSGIFR